MRTSSKLVSLKDLKSLSQTMYDLFYPAGKARKTQFVGEDSPNDSLPFGVTATWELDTSYDDKFLKIDNVSSVGTNGGNANHTLTITEMPYHNHETEPNGSHKHTVTTDWKGQHSHNHEGAYSVKYTVSAAHYNLNWPYNYSDRPFYMGSAGKHTHTATSTYAENHTHGITAQGGGQPFALNPQYKTFKIWKRVL